MSGNDDARRLFEDLLSGYNKLVRPEARSGNRTEPLNVKFKMRLSQLLDVVSLLGGRRFTDYIIYITDNLLKTFLHNLLKSFLYNLLKAFFLYFAAREEPNRHHQRLA